MKFFYNCCISAEILEKIAINIEKFIINIVNVSKLIV